LTKIALAVVILVAVTGVGSASPAGPTLYPHVYRAKIAGSGNPLLNATWLLSVQRTVFGLKRNGGTAVVGSVTVTGNKITFHDLGGPLSCRGAQVNGLYSWKVTGAKLTLTRFKDTCLGRRSVLAYAFTRIS
jgi:hypothetical protein